MSGREDRERKDGRGEKGLRDMREGGRDGCMWRQRVGRTKNVRMRLDVDKRQKRGKRERQ